MAATRIASRQKRLYLNFGDDWRTDFTVTVEPGDARLFLVGDASVAAAERLQTFRQAWEGKRVRLGPRQLLLGRAGSARVPEPGLTRSVAPSYGVEHWEFRHWTSLSASGSVKLPWIVSKHDVNVG